MMAVIEPVMDLGNIITLLGTVGSIVIAFWRLTIQLARLETKYEMKIEMLWRQFLKDHKIDDN